MKVKSYSRWVYRLLILLFFTSCTSGQVREDWQKIAGSEEYKKEFNTFLKRLGATSLCHLEGITDFAFNNKSPMSGCIYPTNPYYEEGGAVLQDRNTLKVLQVVPNGFLAKFELAKCESTYSCYRKTGERNLFIEKSDQENIVDGDFLDSFSRPSELYLYVGPKSYESLGGGRVTVHSFKKIPKSLLADAQKGLVKYDPNLDLLGLLNSWSELGAHPRFRALREAANAGVTPENTKPSTADYPLPRK